MKPLLLLLLLAGSLLASPRSIIASALRNEKLNEEQRTELATLYLTQTDIFLKTLKEDLPPELQKAGQALAKTLEQVPSEDGGINRIGAAVGWFTKYDGDEITTCPIISLTRKKSPAEKAKIKVGDVIVKAAGVSLSGASSRNKFINLIHLWPTATKLHLEILRSPGRLQLSETILRDKEFKTTITLSAEAFK